MSIFDMEKFLAMDEDEYAEYIRNETAQAKRDYYGEVENDGASEEGSITEITNNDTIDENGQQYLYLSGLKFPVLKKCLKDYDIHEDIDENEYIDDYNRHNLFYISSALFRFNLCQNIKIFMKISVINTCNVYRLYDNLSCLNFHGESMFHVYTIIIARLNNEDPFMLINKIINDNKLNSYSCNRIKKQKISLTSFENSKPLKTIHRNEKNKYTLRFKNSVLDDVIKFKNLTKNRHFRPPGFAEGVERSNEEQLLSSAKLKDKKMKNRRRFCYYVNLEPYTFLNKKIVYKYNSRLFNSLTPISRIESRILRWDKIRDIRGFYLDVH